MKIERITIANFGVISDLNLDLSGDSGDLVFLNGRNGRGKTTFQSALRWLFYNQEPAESEKFLSNLSFQNASIGSGITIRVSAEIAMDQPGVTATIERTQTFVKTQEGLPSRVGYPNLQVSTKSSGVDPFTNVLPKPELWLEKYFPERLINFFLFDGELMKDFFERNVRKSIEDAVKEIAGVDLFDLARTNLFTLKESLNRKISKSSGSKAEGINADLETQEKIHAAITKDLNTARDRLSNNRAIKDDVLKKLAKLEGLGDASARLKRIDEEILENQQNFLTANQEFETELLRIGTTCLLFPSFEELKNQIVQAEADDCLPPKFEPARIKQLLDDQECICGSPLHSGDSKRAKLEQMIEAFSVASDVGKRLESTRRGSESISASTQTSWRYLEEKNDAIPKFEEKLSRLAEEKKSILLELEGQDVDEISTLTSKQRQLDSYIELDISAVTRLQVQEENSHNTLKKLQKEFEEASKGNQEAEIYKQQVKWATDLLAAASEIHSLAIQQVRERLQKTVSERFSKVKKGNFHTVITENFQVQTLTSDGTELPLSEGERMMKAYIFSIALREVIGLGFPLIVDTPFGRLDEFNRNELAQVLSEFLLNDKTQLNRQVIFLMHDGEYTPYTRKHFEKANPKEVYLAFEKGFENINSILGEGIDPEWFETSAWKDWAKGNIK